MSRVAIKYTDLLKLNSEYTKTLPEKKYKVSVLSNIIVAQLNNILEYNLRIDGVPATLSTGDYDNIVQDSQKYKDSNTIIIFWELCNIIDGLQYKIELSNNHQFDEIFEKTKLEIDLVLKNLEKTSLVLINKFTSLPFSSFNIRVNHLDKLADQLNNYLEKKILSNIRLFDIDKVIASIGVTNSLDLRYYYSSKALYTVNFFKAYAEYVKPLIMSANGKAKKAIIFDCDNTLWKGILGEDGFDSIEMSAATKDGSIFAEIQLMALALNKQGILIGLCSKNNLEDVNEVIESHQDMQAGWSRYASAHITALISVDLSTRENGCLELAAGFHERGLIGKEWAPLSEKQFTQANYIAVEAAPGDAIFFDSLTPHRSGSNNTDRPRRILYYTYNKASEGDHLTQYYADKRESYPPDIERKAGKKYVYRV